MGGGCGIRYISIHIDSIGVMEGKSREERFKYDSYYNMVHAV